jgi:hypothetical protein
MTPAQKAALKYRIWAYASAREWDVTLHDIADHLDCSAHTVRGLCQYSGWLPRLRRTSYDGFGRWNGFMFDQGDHEKAILEDMRDWSDADPVSIEWAE